MTIALAQVIQGIALLLIAVGLIAHLLAHMTGRV